MADIKQAAKWLEEGKRVGRPHELPALSVGKGNMDDGLEYDDGSPAIFCAQDFLADDWEIAE